mmetsp:Transcript_5330/g.15396  ORF Transcript_5330/g.15396 Transcript_5330/m.15396 type:complete len:285 (-) Transcript_5330:338-1192(-)
MSNSWSEMALQEEASLSRQSNAAPSKSGVRESCRTRSTVRNTESRKLESSKPGNDNAMAMSTRLATTNEVLSTMFLLNMASTRRRSLASHAMIVSNDVLMRMFAFGADTIKSAAKKASTMTPDCRRRPSRAASNNLPATVRTRSPSHATNVLAITLTTRRASYTRAIFIMPSTASAARDGEMPATTGPNNRSACLAQRPADAGCTATSLNAQTARLADAACRLYTEPLNAAIIASRVPSSLTCDIPTSSSMPGCASWSQERKTSPTRFKIRFTPCLADCLLESS